VNIYEDRRTSSERVADLAYEERLRTLTEARKWDELRLLCLMHGSALSEREPDHLGREPAP
jgi:hypothetical protein